MTRLLLPDDPTPEDTRLRTARWGLAIALAAGVGLGAVDLWQGAVVLLVAAVVLAWATR